MNTTWMAGIVGGVVGGVVGFLLATRTTTSPEPPTDLGPAIVDLRDAVVALREVASRPALQPASGSAPSPAGAGAREPEPPPRTTEPDDGRTATPPAIPSDGERDATLLAFASFSEEERADERGVLARAKGFRRRWLLASEDSVLESFGKPDRIQPSASTENWSYFVPTTDEDGQPRVEEIVLVFSRGRLVQAW